jgi:antitoxin component of MazEF toxin-antitoxin module
MQKIIRSGNSLAITIPAKFAKKIGLKVGDEAKVIIDPIQGTLLVQFKSMRQLTFFK